jgi:putative NADPH-quinone reductase
VKAFVVACHPVDDSFHAAILDRVLAGLEAGGADVRRVHLAEEAFRPELSAVEHAAHRRPDAAADRPDIAHHVDALRWCDTLVLVYPTWWGGQPAILTGWFDRVLCSGVAFELTPRNRLRPLLGNVRRLAVVTTHGSSKRVNAVQGEGGKRVASRAVRSVLGRWRTRFTWLAMYGVDRSSRDERQRFLDRVERELSSLSR